MNRIIVGADIAKLKFDVALKLLNGKWINCEFSNDQKGFTKFLKWLEKPDFTSMTLVMEATGCYGEDLAQHMYDNGHTVIIVNPAQIKFFGQSKLSRSKTDKKDARLIAEFGMQNSDLTPWEPKTKSQKKQRDLFRFLVNLKDDRVQCLNRLEAARDDDVRATLQAQKNFLDKTITDIENKIKEVISKDEVLNKNASLIQCIKGVGEITSWCVLAEIPDISNFQHAKQLVAFAGLNPTLHESGSSVRGRRSISKMGSHALRKSLYLPAITAMRYNPIIKEFAEHLKANQKKGKEVIVACMRKLLHAIYAVLKKQTPFCA